MTSASGTESSAPLIVVGADGSASSFAALDWAARPGGADRHCLEAVTSRA